MRSAKPGGMKKSMAQVLRWMLRLFTWRLRLFTVATVALRTVALRGSMDLRGLLEVAHL